MSVDGSSVAVDTAGETTSRTEPARAKGDCPAPAVGAPVIATGAPLAVMAVVGASSSARVTATAAVASSSPAPATTAAVLSPTAIAGLMMTGTRAEILATVAATMPCTTASPLATMAAAILVSTEIPDPCAARAVLLVPASAVLVAAPTAP